MCSSAPKVKPVASAPIISPTSIDDQAINERDKTRQRLRAANGRQSTILAGSSGQPPTGSFKTALGA